MYSANQIANYVINYCYDNGIFITNLHLQKLLYFIQGEYCRKNHNRLIADDFYAWKLGPVVPEVYSKYAICSSSIIPKQKDEETINVETMHLIQNVLQKYAQLSVWDLVEISHQQDPWKYNYEIFGDKAIIPFESISNYFQENV